MFQAFLISPNGEVVWSQQGYPKNNSWVESHGSTTQFQLIGSYNGSVKNHTAVILAVGDPIFIDGTSETRVILGMKRFSFSNSTRSTEFDPSAVSPQVSRRSTPSKTTSRNSKNEKFDNIRYVKKKYSGYTYTEVVGIPISTRKEIFYELVKYQDATGDDSGAYRVVAKRYSIPEKATKSIATEGALKRWPMP